MLTFDLADAKRRDRNLSAAAAAISAVILCALLSDVVWPACVYLAVILMANLVRAIGAAADLKEFSLSDPDERSHMKRRD